MARSRARVALLALAVVSSFALTGPGAIAAGCESPSADASICGQWGAPFSQDGRFDAAPPATPEESMEQPPGSSIVMLPSGKVLYWGALTALENGDYPLAAQAGETGVPSPSRVLDLSSGTPQWLANPTPEAANLPGYEDHDLFCADQRVLADGRIMAVGGTVWKNDPVDLTPYAPPGAPPGTAELFGSNATRMYDPATNSWDVEQNMNYGRWYPTLTTLGDGRLFVAGGVGRLLYNSEGHNIHESEIFDPATNEWTLNTNPESKTTLPLFARMHLMPDGKVFYGGVGQMWGPFGQGYDEALEHLQQAFDPATTSWQITGVGAVGARSGAFSVLLPLRPDANGQYGDEAKLLVFGGTLGTEPGAYVATDLTEIVTYKNGQSSGTLVAPLNNRRWYSSGVLLPTGEVVAVSGADKDEVITPGAEYSVRQAELWDGTSWKPLASATRERTYHNAAILLPDGSVLVGGHSPINALYGPKGDNSMHQSLGTAQNMKDPSFEILKPPYLFRGDRPQIDRVNKGLGYGESFTVDTLTDGTDVDQLVLVRLPATTHVTDADMRAVELPITGRSAGAVSAVTPASGNIAPPGWYYLFALSDNQPGLDASKLVPSKAHIVRIGAGSDATAAVAPFGK